MTIAERLAAARARIARVTPVELQSADDALVIDLRCREDRAASGVVPWSISVLLSQLEWRCDPTSPWSDERVARPGARVILVCADGFSSSLAAASLADLGFSRVGDLDGGMNGWVREGLPLAPAEGQPTTMVPIRQG